MPSCVGAASAGSRPREVKTEFMTLLGINSDKGRVKQVDQDACCFLEAQTIAGPAAMAIICDGVGGLSKGELASSTVVRRFADWFTLQFPKFLEYNAHDEELMDLLRNVWDTLLQMSSENVYRYSVQNDITLGTTFTGMIAVGGRYLIAHVGDCRAYEVSNEAALQLTHDQTLVAQQVAAGLLTPEEAEHHPKRNVIMQSVGTSESVEPEFIVGDYRPDATYVLCCDGFYNRLQKDELHVRFRPSGTISEAALQDVCDEMVAQVMERGEKDNVTVVSFIGVGSDTSDVFPQERLDSAPDDDDSPTEVAGHMPQPAQAADQLETDDPRSGESQTEESSSDDEESPTIVVDEDESPTVVVKGGGR